MRVYFDRQGRVRGYGMGGGWLLLAFYVLFIPLIAVFWWLPQGVARTGWDPGVKVLVVLSVWVALIVLGALVPNR